MKKEEPQSPTRPRRGRRTKEKNETFPPNATNKLKTRNPKNERLALQNTNNQKLQRRKTSTRKWRNPKKSDWEKTRDQKEEEAEALKVKGLSVVTLLCFVIYTLTF